jgi:hypothetical protein
MAAAKGASALQFGEADRRKKGPITDPEGVTEISRWLSVAKPPETEPGSNDPGGVAAAASVASRSVGMERDPRHSLCDPFGVEHLECSQPVVSLRSTTG